MWQEFLMVLTIVGSFAVLPLGLLYVRRRWLTGQGGVFDCSYKQNTGADPSGWTLGWARYRGEEVQWFRAFSLSPSPRFKLRRPNVVFLGSRPPTASEQTSLYDGSIVLRFQVRGDEETILLAMDRPTAMALVSWLEASPPGLHTQRP